jgi:hypothetical protein
MFLFKNSLNAKTHLRWFCELKKQTTKYSGVFTELQKESKEAKVPALWEQTQDVISVSIQYSKNANRKYEIHYVTSQLPQRAQLTINH